MENTAVIAQQRVPGKWQRLVRSCCGLMVKQERFVKLFILC